MGQYSRPPKVPTEMDNYTLRDASFYLMYKAMKVQAQDLPERNINVEFGYGGARLLDCRWLGPIVFDELIDCIRNLDGGSLTVIGLSAGNIIAASLAILLPLRHLCCGFDNRHRKRQFQVNRDVFEKATNLRIPSGDLCACDTVRRIYDFLFETTALFEHPSYTPSHETILNMFSGEETVESALGSNVASTYTNMYINEPFRYAAVMYRVMDDLQGKMNLAYILSRFLLTRCAFLGQTFFSTMPPTSSLLTINISSKDIQTNQFVFTDIANLRPLSRLVPGRPRVYKNDAEVMNQLLQTLMFSVDVREILMPVLSDFIWKRKYEMLSLREDADPETILHQWNWDGTVPSYNRHDTRLMKRAILLQDTVDIMSNTKGHLPNFSNGGANYIFEISPLGKHLFSTDCVNGLFRACTPAFQNRGGETKLSP